MATASGELQVTANGAIRIKCGDLQQTWWRLARQGAAEPGGLNAALMQAQWNRDCQASYGDYDPNVNYMQRAAGVVEPPPVNTDSPASGTAPTMANGYAVGSVVPADTRGCVNLWGDIGRTSAQGQKNYMIAAFQSACGMAYDPTSRPLTRGDTSGSTPPPVIQYQIAIAGGGTKAWDGSHVSSGPGPRVFGHAGAGLHSRPDAINQMEQALRAEKAKMCSDYAAQYIAAFHTDGTVDKHLKSDMLKQLNNSWCSVPNAPYYALQPKDCSGLSMSDASGSSDSLGAELVGRPIGKLIEHPLVGGVCAVTGGVGLTVLGTMFVPEVMVFKYAREGTLGVGTYAGLYVNGVFWGFLEDGLASKLGHLVLEYSPLALFGKGEEWLFKKVLGDKWGHILGKMNFMNALRGVTGGKSYEAAKCAKHCELKTGSARDACKLGARFSF